MVVSPTHPGRRIPVQERSREKYDAILRACRDVLLEDGFEKTTTARVAARAGVGKGVLYQYFPNRETLVTTLVESELNLLVTRTIDAQRQHAGDEPYDTARRLLRMNVEFWLENRRLLRAFLSEVPGVFELPGIRRLETRVAEFTTSLLDKRPGGERPAAIERKIYVLNNVIAGFILRLALVAPPAASADELTDELMIVLESYVDRSSLGAWIATR